VHVITTGGGGAAGEGTPELSASYMPKLIFQGELELLKLGLMPLAEAACRRMSESVGVFIIPRAKLGSATAGDSAEGPVSGLGESEGGSVELLKVGGTRKALGEAVRDDCATAIGALVELLVVLVEEAAAAVGVNVALGGGMATVVAGNKVV
jgi:hypothetical protein